VGAHKTKQHMMMMMVMMIMMMNVR